MSQRDTSSPQGASRTGAVPQPVRWLEAYYLATPVFLLIDIVLGMPLRVSTLTTPALKYSYYAFLLGCGLAIHARPRTGPWIGITESALNFSLVIVAILMPYWRLLDQAADPNSLLTNPFTPAIFVNALLTGTIAIISINANQEKIWLSLKR